MNSSAANPWTTVVTILGALGIGTIIGAAFARWNAISNLRQNWIDALREDLVMYLKEIDARVYRVDGGWRKNKPPATTEDLEKQQDTRNACLLVYRRILL